jgi:DNA-binding Lrp family transcriptional regulator
MTKVETRLLSELLKNSKKSDRELAKLMNLSQPTITRKRHKLERDGWVQQYTIIPDFAKMGFTILAINCLKSTLNKKFTEKAGRVTMSKPNVLFAAGCCGMGMDTVVVSLHKSYSDYIDFIREVRSEDGETLKRTDSLIISLEGSVTKPFGLKYLAETLAEERI